MDRRSRLFFASAPQPRGTVSQALTVRCDNGKEILREANWIYIHCICIYIYIIYYFFDNAIIFYIFMPIHEDLLLNHQASEHKLSQQRALVMSCWALPIGLRYAAILECTISSFKLLIQQLNAQNIQNHQRGLSRSPNQVQHSTLW